jgi:hypothetical protein
MSHLKPLLLGAALAFAATPSAAMTFTAMLDGMQEVPPNASPATGMGTIRIVGDMMKVAITYSDLSSQLTVAHIHCCAPFGANAGVAVDLDKIPLPVTLSGSFLRSFDLTSPMTYSASFLTASGGTAELARMRLVEAFVDQTAYFNLHTVNFPPGEIRGQIAQVPEPGTWAMLIAGFGLVGAAARRRSAILA